MQFGVLSSWSLEFALRNSQFMTFASVLRYRQLLVRQRRKLGAPGRRTRLRMRAPFKGDVWLRDIGSDEDTFKEIVIEQVYGHLLRLGKCEYIVDLGANIGLATRVFAAAYPHAKLFAVEPDPANYELLECNVSDLISAARCRVRRAAVWERDGPLYVEPPPGGTEFNGVRVSERSGNRAASRIADGLTMSSVLAEAGFPFIDLLKVDIEGAEAILFKGDLGWLKKTRALAIEFHGDSRMRSGFERVMAEFGFAVDDSNPHTTVALRKLGAP